MSLETSDGYDFKYRKLGFHYWWWDIMFARMHGASLIDTMGIGLILTGLMFQAGFTLITGKLLLILVFVFFTSPTSSYALARAAINGGLVAEVQDDGGSSKKEA